MDVFNHCEVLAINRRVIPFLQCGCLHVRGSSAPAAQREFLQQGVRDFLTSPGLHCV